MPGWPRYGQADIRGVRGVVIDSVLSTPHAVQHDHVFRHHYSVVVTKVDPYSAIPRLRPRTCLRLDRCSDRRIRDMGGDQHRTRSHRFLQRPVAIEPAPGKELIGVDVVAAGDLRHRIGPSQGLLDHSPLIADGGTPGSVTTASSGVCSSVSTLPPGGHLTYPTSPMGT